MAADDLVTLSDVKAHLNITGTSHDTELSGFISAATPVVEDIVGPVTTRTVDEWYTGGGSKIVLRQYPVASITSVTEYAGTTGTALTQANVDTADSYAYTLESGGVLARRTGSLGTNFTTGVDNVHVVYVAGRSSIPANIRLAALELIRHWYQLTQQGGRPQLGGAAEDGMFTPSGFAVPARVVELLAPHQLPPGLS